MRWRSSRRVVPWGLLRADPYLASLGKRLLASTRVTFYTLVFDMVFDIDFLLSWNDFGSQLGPMLGAFWYNFLS